MKVVRPWTKVIQSSALEPWVLRRAYQKHTDATQGALTLLKFGRSLLRICVLLRQHCTSTDVKALLIACLYATPGRLFPESARSESGADTAFGRLLPGFLLALPGFLRADGPKFRKVGLMAPARVDGDCCNHAPKSRAGWIRAGPPGGGGGHMWRAGAGGGAEFSKPRAMCGVGRHLILLPMSVWCIRRGKDAARGALSVCVSRAASPVRQSADRPRPILRARSCGSRVGREPELARRQRAPLPLSRQKAL